MYHLKLLSNTKAEFKYFRNQDEPGVAKETVVFDRTPLLKCQVGRRLN